jgi:ESCRT-I complex subunit VPS28
MNRPPVNTEIKLYENGQERKRAEELADLYAIIKTTESLEAAFSRDAINSSEYAAACTKLISQFRTTESALLASGAIESAEKFFREFLDCPRARNRLLVVGVPATVVHATHDERGEAVIVAETVQGFITAMDALKLNQRAVDEVQPLISELMNSLTRVKGISPETFEGSKKLSDWLSKLNQLRAVEEIDDDEARQLVFDLEAAYNDFHRFLKVDQSKK